MPAALDPAHPLGLTFTHHGAVRGVTGSCHQLTLPGGASVLVDCGLFQGAETSPCGGAGPGRLEIGFALDGVLALVVTHVHIDHVGRIPYLLAAGFKGPIVCSAASAELLPMVLQDALEVGFTRDKGLIARVMAALRAQIVPVHYKQWHVLLPGVPGLKLRFQPAGHILGSAFVEIDCTLPAAAPPAAGARATHDATADDGLGSPPRRAAPGTVVRRVVFSGDLGAPYTPLLPAPQSPLWADVVVLESTYGDRTHESRKDRRQRLQALCEHAFGNGGTVLIPAFSIGRTQELLCELEDIIHRHRRRAAAPGLAWQDVTVVVDSPLAADFTEGYARLKAHWDAEARTHLAHGRHPLDFAQLKTVDSHELHLKVVQHLATSGQPAIVIAASGMCAGGRIVNYLKAMLGDARHDILFCGYQAAGTPGRVIQQQGARAAQAGGAGGGWVDLDGERIPIRARVHTLGGYSAHADQKDLLAFIGRMHRKPRQVRLVHGDEPAKAELARLLRGQHPGVDVVVPVG